MPEGAAHLLFAVLIVFGSAKLLAEAFERLKQPGIVGEILAGVLVGPGVLGWVAPGGTLDHLAELGVIFLLFRVGLEVRSSELLRVGGPAAGAALLGVAAPLLLGWGIMRLWGGSLIESLFVGAAMVATSVGITAQVLSARGLLDQVASKVTLAAAVIDDVLGLLILAFVSAMARGSVNLGELAGIAVAAFGFTLLVARWGSTAMTRVVPRVEARLQAVEAQFNLSMMLLFGLALLAVYAGVAAIIGAFLAGMALSESLGSRAKDLAHGVTEFLVPFFLVGIGLHLDLDVFASLSTILLAAVILVAAVLSKLVGCGLGAWTLGRADALRVGVGMIPRGEVGMVVAQIGLSLGVVSGAVYGVVVFMAVVTTLMAPPLLAAAYRGVPAREARQEFQIG